MKMTKMNVIVYCNNIGGDVSVLEILVSVLVLGTCGDCSCGCLMCCDRDMWFK